MEVKIMGMKRVLYGVLISAMMPAFAEDFSGTARFGFNEYGFYVHMSMNGRLLPYMPNGFYPLAYSDRFADRSYNRAYHIAQKDGRVSYDYRSANGRSSGFIPVHRYQGQSLPRYPAGYGYYANPYPY